jgi:hypothetical protein
LREVLHDDLVSLVPRPGIRRLRAREHSHQRGFAGPVRADQRNAIATFDVQAQIVEHDEIPVRLAHVLQVEHGPPALRADRERKPDALPFRRHFDGHDFFEQLDPALDLGGFRGLVPEPVDELLDPRDLLVLLAFGLPEALQTCVALVDVVAVAAGVIR